MRKVNEEKKERKKHELRKEKKRGRGKKSEMIEIELN